MRCRYVCCSDHGVLPRLPPAPAQGPALKHLPAVLAAPGCHTFRRPRWGDTTDGVHIMILVTLECHTSAGHTGRLSVDGASRGMGCAAMRTETYLPSRRCLCLPPVCAELTGMPHFSLGFFLVTLEDASWQRKQEQLVKGLAARLLIHPLPAPGGLDRHAYTPRRKERRGSV